jgi:hypothetical protein
MLLGGEEGLWTVRRQVLEEAGCQARSSNSAQLGTRTREPVEFVGGGDVLEDVLSSTNWFTLGRRGT